MLPSIAFSRGKGIWEIHVFASQLQNRDDPGAVKVDRNSSMHSAAVFLHEPIRTNGLSYLACTRRAPCMLRHAAAAILPISQPMHCASVTGRAHTLAIWAAFGGVAGDSSRGNLPSGLLLVPLRACQVHRFPPGGPHTLHVLPHCCHFVWGA